MWTTDRNTLYFNVYDENIKKIFSIYIPSENLIKEPELLNSDKYVLKKISNNNLWIFNWWTCLYDKNANVCSLYISKNWTIYVDDMYKNQFVASYNYNVLGNIEVTFYWLSVPNKSLLTNDKKIFNYVFKAKSFINK